MANGARDLVGRAHKSAELQSGYTPSGLHQATDVVIDLVLDKANARTLAHRLRQVGLVVRRFLVERDVQRRAAKIESLGSFKKGNDPERGKRFNLHGASQVGCLERMLINVLRSIS